MRLPVSRLLLPAVAALAAAALCLSVTIDVRAQGRSDRPEERKDERKEERRLPPRDRPTDPQSKPEGKGEKGGKGADSAESGKGKDNKGGASPHRRAAKPPGASIPDDPVKRARLLKDLYAFLATAEDQEAANQIAEAIERVWMSAAGDTVLVLLDRAVKSAASERPDLALSMLDTVTRIAPDFPEGFNRRAYVYYSLNEYERALGDLRRVLAMEPNHYKALEGLGQILRDTDQKKAALEVYRRLVLIHPFAQGAKSTLEELERTVAGQGS
jgi:tetratricopeptide (TPR) repeat protein